MGDSDIRWIQRFKNYKRALDQLGRAVQLMHERELSELEKQGVIQAFEFTHELSWKTMKDFLEHRGNSEIYGSKDSVRLAFKLGIIESGDVWMQMVKSRNLSIHTYDEQTANEIVEIIRKEYYPAFVKFRETMEKILEDDDVLWNN